MRTNAPTLSEAPTLRGWFRTASLLWATHSPAPSAGRRRSIVEPWRAAFDGAIIVPAAIPTALRSGAAIESPEGPVPTNITAEDWDLLFQSVLQRLAGVATAKVVPDEARMRLQDPGAALGECIDALDQLRRWASPRLPAADER